MFDGKNQVGEVVKVRACLESQCDPFRKEHGGRGGGD